MSKYSPEVVEVVGELAAKGHTDLEIIKSLGISSKTYYAWLKEKPEFKQAIHLNRKVLAQTVVPKLLKRARGYRFTERTTEYEFTKQGEKVKTSEKTVSKQVAPDTSAIKYILNNWDHENWQDKQTTEHEIPDGYGVILIPENKSAKDWEKAAQSVKDGDFNE